LFIYEPSEYIQPAGDCKQNIGRLFFEGPLALNAFFTFLLEYHALGQLSYFVGNQMKGYL